MMRRYIFMIALGSSCMFGCAVHAKKPVTVGTIAELHEVRTEVEEIQVEQGLDQAMKHYRQFLEETPEAEMTPEAMRRLADLQIEKQYGIHTGNTPVKALAEPQPGQALDNAEASSRDPYAATSDSRLEETDQEFERRTTAESRIQSVDGVEDLPAVTAISETDPSGPIEAIALYDRLLTEYPGYRDSDQVLYQMARAYDELGRTDEAMATMDRLVRTNPDSEHFDEVEFRRGEYYFTRRKYRDAEDAYAAIISQGSESPYYELALYKLGWTFYKQELYEYALHRYMTLLDYKVSTGYDFDQTHEEEDERRVADTFRVISLSFNNLGGPETVPEYFTSFGNRSYEDRVYDNLGEHYLSKLRYDDAAKTFRAFIALYPFHRSAPRFSMNVVKTFTKGGFSKLVLESKREFADRYGLRSEYWQHHEPEELPEVLSYLKTNLTDLATHYHAEYQGADKTDEKLAAYHEARRWYNEYLESFPADEESPAMNYRLADLQLENEDFGEAAKQYERTAYDYPLHSQSAAAGYAAVYAHRQELAAASEQQQNTVKRDTVASSLKFADTFPEHEQAAVVLGAAADDLYEMKEYTPAVESARRLIETYPNEDEPLRRSAWIVVAHGSFELGEYPDAEYAYTRVLAATSDSDESRAGFVDNLAASIYKQGEGANESGDYRAAADHFLRIRSAAPTSGIRSTAEYDAGTALIRLESWQEAVAVFEDFRNEFPDHKLHVEATRQIAYAYRESEQLFQAAAEYERLSSETEDPALRSEAMLLSGDLYDQSDARDRALDVYNRYVNEFPDPVETALETRNKIAEMYKAADRQSLYHQELEQIVRIDTEAGEQRTSRTRTLAARAALVLAEVQYRDFVSVKLLQPFEESLQNKQQSMDKTIEKMSRLVEYEIADVTAAATYYMAETYLDFSRSLLESERPSDLDSNELELYEMDLDEAAFPFEERAISVHEKNMELLHAGVFNPWIEKSLASLVDLMPGRYAKEEVSSGFLGTIERYVYRTPASKALSPASGDIETVPAEPDLTIHPVQEPGDDGGEKHATLY